jgi:hypothetical protein
MKELRDFGTYGAMKRKSAFLILRISFRVAENGREKIKEMCR